MAISSAFNPWIDGRAFRPNPAQQEIIQQKGTLFSQKFRTPYVSIATFTLLIFSRTRDSKRQKKTPGRLGTDSVALDIRMSMRKEVEAARQIRNLAAVTKVVIFCMHSSAHIAEQAKPAGADPCL